MSDKIVYDFVCCFLPEHKIFWDCLSEKEASFLNNIKIKEEELEKVIFAPEENERLVEKYRDKLDIIELILNHRECAYDFFLYQKIKDKLWRLDILSKDSYDFIFAEPDKYAVQIREPKTIYGYMKKILALLPQAYQEKTSCDRKRFFGEFKCHLDSVSFETQDHQTNPIIFTREQMNLIPYFVEYRNKNFLKAFFDYNSRKEYDDSLRTYGKSTFLSELNQKFKDVEMIFEKHFSDKIWELLNLYHLHNPPSSPAEVNYDKYGGWFEIKYEHHDDSQRNSRPINYRYNLKTEDIFNSIKKFRSFLGQTEKKR